MRHKHLIEKERPVLKKNRENEDENTGINICPIGLPYEGSALTNCRQVGHNYKTCPNRRSSTRSTRPADNHEVLIQDLTDQLPDHLRLDAAIDKEDAQYALFSPSSSYSSLCRR